MPPADRDRPLRPGDGVDSISPQVTCWRGAKGGKRRGVARGRRADWPHRQGVSRWLRPFPSPPWAELLSEDPMVSGFAKGRAGQDHDGLAARVIDLGRARLAIGRTFCLGRYQAFRCHGSTHRGGPRTPTLLKTRDITKPLKGSPFPTNRSNHPLGLGRLVQRSGCESLFSVCATVPLNSRVCP